MLKVDHDLMIAHVDIGARGLIRRLGLEKIVDAIVKLFSKKSDYLTKERLVSWKFVQPLSINPVSKTIKINVPQKDFSHIPPAELGDIMMDLDPVQQINLFTTLEPETRSKIFGHLDFKTQREIVGKIGPKAGAVLLNKMPDDEATDFLERMPRRTVDHILEKMETKEVKKLSRLLGYASDSAGGLMTTDFIAIQKDITCENALNIIKERAFYTEPIQYVFVVDENKKLLGTTNLRRLIRALPADIVSATIFPKTLYVHLEDGVQEVAYLMEKYKCQALPVVNNENILQGIITIDDILSQVIAIAWRKTRRKVPRTL
jgi:Mg/Co/Ni transporter MgtE